MTSSDRPLMQWADGRTDDRCSTILTPRQDAARTGEQTKFPSTYRTKQVETHHKKPPSSSYIVI